MNVSVRLSVYLSLSVRDHRPTSGITHPYFTKFCVHVSCGRGSCRRGRLSQGELIRGRKMRDRLPVV